MNIKGILRSTAAKFIAFAGIVGVLRRRTVSHGGHDNGFLRLITEATWSIALRATLPTRTTCVSSSA